MRTRLIGHGDAAAVAAVQPVNVKNPATLALAIDVSPDDKTGKPKGVGFDVQLMWPWACAVCRGYIDELFLLWTNRADLVV